jgi:four helix bundle protein
LAHSLGVEIHHLSLQMPKFELYESGSQLRRAAKSISANIVEGFGRRCYKAEFIRFLIYAHSSCIETQEWLEYIRDCHAGLEASVEPVWQKVDRLSRQLNRFLRTVESNHRSPK